MKPSPEHVLRDAVALLTRESAHRFEDAEGQAHYVRAAPLLVQLRLEIGNGSNSGGGASKTTAAIPLAAAALDLLTEITDTVHDEWWRAHALHHGHGRGTVVGELRAWAAVAEDKAAAAKLCTGWVNAITALLVPVRRWEIKADCPACKAGRTVASLDVGETVYAPALCIEFLPGGARGMCRACGATFAPEVLARLLATA